MKPAFFDICREPDYILFQYPDSVVRFEEPDSHEFTVSNVNGVYVVEGDWLYRVMGNINFSDRESLMYFQRVLRNSGVIKALEEKGATDGDTVSIYDFEFDFLT